MESQRQEHSPLDIEKRREDHVRFWKGTQRVIRKKGRKTRPGFWAYPWEHKVFSRSLLPFRTTFAQSHCLPRGTGVRTQDGEAWDPNNL